MPSKFYIANIQFHTGLSSYIGINKCFYSYKSSNFMSHQQEDTGRQAQQKKGINH